MIYYTITWARGKVVYRLASIKCYVLHSITTKPSPGHITAKNGHFVLTVQTLAVGEMLQSTGKGLLCENEKLKLSALALSLQGAYQRWKVCYAHGNRKCPHQSLLTGQTPR